MIFVGSKVFTHARYWQIKKYVCMICGGGGTWGGTENLWGGGGHVPPQAPRSYAPALKVPTWWFDMNRALQCK